MNKWSLFHNFHLPSQWTDVNLSSLSLTMNEPGSLAVKPKPFSATEYRMALVKHYFLWRLELPGTFTVLPHTTFFENSSPKVTYTCTVPKSLSLMVNGLNIQPRKPAYLLYISKSSEAKIIASCPPTPAFTSRMISVTSELSSKVSVCKIYEYQLWFVSEPNEAPAKIIW